MSWSYRIVSHAGADSDVMHDIREVHVDGDGKMVGVAGTAFAPVHFASWSDDVRASLIWQLERALDAVRTAPIVPMPTAPQGEEGGATEGLSGEVPGLADGRMPIVLPLCTGLDGEIFDAAGRCFLQVDPNRELRDDQVAAIGRMIVDRVNDGRYERLVRRIAEWTDGEIAVVCPRQTRHVAQVVVAGADPVYYPSFAPSASPKATATASVRKCGATPDHADIMETIENAADDWQAKGYTSALAEVRDMANVGRALMEALPKGYHYMNCPSEIVSDLQNQLSDIKTFGLTDSGTAATIGGERA